MVQALPSDLQEAEVILDVLFVLQDVGFKVHEGAGVRLGPERGLGQDVLRNPLQEGHHTLVVSAFCSKNLSCTYIRNCTVASTVCCAPAGACVCVFVFILHVLSSNTDKHNVRKYDICH